MHNNVIIGLSILAAFTFSIMLALYGARLWNRDRQWQPRRYGISAREVACSFCRKPVRAEAIVCRHCHRSLDEVTEDTQTQTQPSDSDEGAIALSSSGKRLAPTPPGSYEASVDPLTSQSVAWLDNAFAQLTVKSAPVAWGVAASDQQRSDRQSEQGVPASDHGERIAKPQNDYSEFKAETVVHADGPQSRNKEPDSDMPKMRLFAWTPRKEWALVAGIASVALIVGGSTFVAGPFTPRIEAQDDYVTFDVSERAPLYTGEESQFPIAGQQETAATVKSSVSTVAAKPAVVADKSTGSSSAPSEVSRTSGEVDRGANTQSLAVISPSQSSLKSAPAPVAVPMVQEDWASIVTQAIRPTQSRELVVAVQRLIRAEGYDPGAIDGLMGPRTRQAILAYQRNGGLPLTGDIDRDLLRKLDLADRTVRVVGPLSGGTREAVRSAAKPAVEWTK